MEGVGVEGAGWWRGGPSTVSERIRAARLRRALSGRRSETLYAEPLWGVLGNDARGGVRCGKRRRRPALPLLDSCLRGNDNDARGGRQALLVAGGEGPTRDGDGPDRLRANGFVKPPALDSRFRGNDDGGVRAGRRCWWREGEGPAAAGRPTSCALRTGFDRLRANGFVKRACLGFPLLRERRWRCRGRRECWLWEGESPAAAGRALREAPLRRVWGVGVAMGVWGGSAPPGARSPFDFPQDERTPTCPSGFLPRIGVRGRLCAGMTLGSAGTTRDVGDRRERAAVWRGLLFGHGNPAGAEELGIVFPAPGDLPNLDTQD